MMHEDDSFDELIRKKLEQRSFTSSPERRAKMQEMIRARNAEKNSRFRMIIFFITLITVSGSILLGNYLFSGKKTAENSHAKTNGTNSVNTPSSTQAFSETQNDAAKNNLTNTNSTDANVVNDANSGTQNSSATNSSLSNSDNSAPSNSLGQHSNSNSGQTAQKPDNNNKNPNKQSPSLTNNVQKKNQSGAKGNQLSTGKQNPSATTASNSVGTGQAHTTYSTDGNNPAYQPTTAANGVGTGQVHTTYSTDGNNPAYQPTTAPNGVGTGQVHTTYSTDGNNPAYHPTTASNGAAQNAQNGNHAQVNNSAAGNSSDTNDRSSAKTNNTVAQQQSQDSDSNKIVSSAASSADSSASSTDDHVTPPQKHGANVNYFFVEAGMNYTTGFSHGDHSGRSVNPVIGGGYCFRVGMKLSMEAALHYTFIGHASDTSIIYTTTTYTFGAHYQYTEVKLQRLHYASLPVSLTWHINGKHAITSGVAVNYLFTTQTHFHTYSETESNINTSSRFGYIQGINRFDVLVMAGYTRTFGQQWSMRLSGFCGLMDVKSNSFYGVNKFERSKGLQFTVQYSF